MTSERASPAATQSPGQKAVRGFGFLFATSTWGKLQGMLVQLLLAYLLSKEDFGKIGLAYTITTFANRLVNPGIGTVLVQRTHRLRLWVTPVFWLSLACGLVGALTMLTIAPIAARFYDVPEVVGLVAVLALAAPIGALTQVPNAILNAQLRFGFLAASSLVLGVLSALLTVTFAALGFGAYCFVLPLPIVSALNVVILWSKARPRIRLRLHLRKWRFFLDRSFWVFTYLLCVTAIGQGDYIVLGSMFDTAVVGVYFFGFNLAMQSAGFVGNNVHAVLYPSLVSVGNQPQRQTRVAVEVSQMLGLTVAHLCVLQALLAGPVLRVLFGERWEGAIVVVQLLSIGVAFESMSSPAIQLLLARGRFRRVAGIYLAGVVTFFLFVYPGAYFGREVGTAAAAATYYLVFWVPLYFIVMTRAGATPRQVLAPFASTVFTNLVAALAGLGVASFLREDWQRICALLLVTPPVYFVVMYKMAPEVCRAALTRLRQLGPARAGAAAERAT